MRSKENAHDYRYFPDPDLMPVKLDDAWLARLKADLPEKPFVRQRRYMADFGLPYTITSVLIPDRALCDFFEKSVAAFPKAPQQTANLIVNEILREIAAAGTEATIADSKISPEALAGLVEAVEAGTISKQQAKEVFADMWNTEKSAADIIKEKGLAQSSDSGELEAMISAVIADPKNADAVASFKGGNERVINVLKGQIMKASRGKVDEIMRKLLA